MNTEVAVGRKGWDDAEVAKQMASKAEGVTTTVTPKPKRPPAHYRHLSVSEAIEPSLVDRIVAEFPKARTPEELTTAILGRLHYPAGELPRMRRRVERFKLSLAKNPRRMPSHIKGLETAIVVIDRAVAQRFDPENNTLAKKAGRAVKRLKDAVEEA